MEVSALAPDGQSPSREPRTGTDVVWEGGRANPLAVRGVGDDGLLPQASNLAGAKIQNGSTAWYVIFGASAGGLAAALTLTRAVREWWRQGFGRRHVAEKRLQRLGTNA